MATVELAKGFFALIAAGALVVLLHRDVDLQDLALRLFDFLHIDPDRRIPMLFLEAAGRFMDLNVIAVMSFAAVYISLRFIEGYGLWRGRVWAEWLALASGAIYLPLEIHALLQKATLVHWLFLITNLVILAYIGYVRVSEHNKRRFLTADSKVLEFPEQ